MLVSKDDAEWREKNTTWTQPTKINRTRDGFLMGFFLITKTMSISENGHKIWKQKIAKY